MRRCLTCLIARAATDPGITLRLVRAKNDWLVKCSTSTRAPPLTLSRKEAVTVYDILRDLKAQQHIEFETIVKLSEGATLTLIHTSTTVHVERREAKKNGDIMRRPFSLGKDQIPTVLIGLKQILHTASELEGIAEQFSVSRFQASDHLRPLSIHKPVEKIPHYSLSTNSQLPPSPTLSDLLENDSPSNKSPIPWFT